MADRMSKAQQVIESLRTEHGEIRDYLERLKGASSPVERLALSRRLGVAIRLHCTLEAGVFFPAIARANKTMDILESVGGEYAAVISLLNELAGESPTGARFEKIIGELRVRVIEHIDAMEADGAFLAQALTVELDWMELEQQLNSRRIQLRRMMDGDLRGRCQH